MSSKSSLGAVSSEHQGTKSAAVLELLQASNYADEVGGERWDFAIEIRRLKKLGLNDTELRWLVRKGYVNPATEVTLLGCSERQFILGASLKFCKQTCFVLTRDGVVYARSLIGNETCENLSGELSSDRNGTAKECILPVWDAVTRELRLGDVIIKRFKWQGINQETVLSAFQEDGWPTVIDDPLPPKEEQDPKRRLHDTIKALNRKQEYSCIRFHGNGTGEGIRWEFIEPE